MILYNVTVKISPEVHEDWLHWMKTVHVPDVMATGLFTDHNFLRLLHVDDSDGPTYCIQYFIESMRLLKEYQNNHAPRLQKEHTERYKDQFVAFRTLLKAV